MNKLLSPIFLISLIILLVNDWYLKVEFPGFITGKLSDVVGLFAFAYFFSSLLPKRKLLVHLSTALIFILWKMPIADGLISIWNEFLPYSIGRVIDYTDYLTLPILLLSYYYNQKPINLNTFWIKKSIIYSVYSLSIFSFLGTAGYTSYIEEYACYDEFSTKEFFSIIQEFYKKYPEYIPPTTLSNIGSKKYLPWAKTKSTLTESEIQEILDSNAVVYGNHIYSPNFYFENEGLIIITRYKTLNMSTSIYIHGVFYEGDEGMSNLNFEWAEEQRIQNLFEEEIIPKINALLKEKYPNREVHMGFCLKKIF